jgi:hypothetical protein
MSVFVKTIRKPSGIVVPLGQVKRPAIVDALDKCSGSYCLAAQLLGIGRTTIYRMARMYNYRPMTIQAERSMTVSQHTSSATVKQTTAGTQALPRRVRFSTNGTIGQILRQFRHPEKSRRRITHKAKEMRSQS